MTIGQIIAIVGFTLYVAGVVWMLWVGCVSLPLVANIK